jgi:endonuclease/exonuclease/phosphatase family metal-dependent hydrolase
MSSLKGRGFAVCVLLVAACGDDIPDAVGTTGDAATTGGATTSSSAMTTGVDDAAGSTSVASTGDAEVPFTGSLRVMTFNVLCSFCDPTYDPWDDRVPWIGDTISRHDPDLIGLQEFVERAEVQQILDAAPGYAPIFYDPDPGTPYPDSTIFYRESQFESVERGFYWLSPEPDTPKSTGFADGFQFPRLVSWTVLRRLDDGARLYFAATHFDNNAPSQELSAPLVLERVAPFVADLPVVMVGDFNSRPDSTAYGILTAADGGFTDAFEIAGQWSVDSNAARPPYDPTERIDHVFVTGGAWTAPSWVVDLWTYGPNDLPVSDHWAITVDLELG